MPSVEPTPEQFRALLAAAERDESAITMLNLLRFHERAAYPEDFEAEPCSGAEAYTRYAEGALEAMSRVGGKPIWGADAHLGVIAPEGERWDQAFLVHYPSRKAFLAMATDPGYLEIVPHRSAALADSRLILCGASERPPERFGAE